MKKILIFIILVSSVFIYSIDLISVKVEKGPKLDGIIDEVWKKAKPIELDLKVPSYFEGFNNPEVAKINENEYFYKVTLKSVYDNDYIYFLVQYKDDKMTIKRQPWMFKDGKWVHGPKHPIIKNGKVIEPAMYEDKFAFLWNINDSIKGFNEVGCMVVCHPPYKATNSSEEVGDIWHFKYVRSGTVGQTDDKHLIYSETNGRKGDMKTSGGYKNNDQTINRIKVPMYWLPGKGERYWIYTSEIRLGEAKRIVKIKGTDLIDEDGNVVPKDIMIPGIIVEPFNGGRGDVLTEAKWKNGIWTIEFKRRLVTIGDPIGYDIEFDDLSKTYYFAVALFDNAATEHAVHFGAIALKFK
ncbi:MULTISPECIES: ethylbenzene dehydrogenase-related protein [unclassified Marinitoga]|uniref:ethylbenzene dehydrogenase-related protein n=1 Tax=unclassified Marinitoga TaxID=2640159 RepID=UPI0006416937|nr:MULTISPECIES: ethylbenzene dehydrogenase-related protein [unclassified Marinitoga]KLO23978.1 hypothetical protein X274_05525 [Marinitoga sp. 1155]NUU99164.1 hypothetical protein [Marinitoga sp. 1154]